MIPEVKENDLVRCVYPGCLNDFSPQYFANINKWKETCGTQCSMALRMLRKKERENRVMITTSPMRLKAPRLLVYGFVILFLLALAFPLFANTVTVSWTANTESDLSGYKIYYGTSSGSYDDALDVGNKTSFSINNLVVGTTYFFAVTAYDFSGNESGFSKEVVYIPAGFTGYTKVELYNILGQRLGNLDRIDLSKLATGIYFKVFLIGSQIIKTERMGLLR